VENTRLLILLLMTDNKRYINNIVIAEFLEWKLDEDTNKDYVEYKVPNRFTEDTGYTSWFASSFQFDNDWNWLMYAWTVYYRKLHIPIMKDNKHLHLNNKLVKKMKNAMIYGHIEGAYEVLVDSIKFYNSLFV